MTASKSITLIIGGGIAAYKCQHLIRLLSEKGIKVTPVLTKAGAEFVTELSLATLAGTNVETKLFDSKREAEIGHIQLSRQSDLLVVAPATANLMAKCANGLADDLASTLLLAANKPILMAPAMNVRMWEHPATQRNLKTLIKDGVHIIGPNNGPMACGETGPGRMAEPEEILAAIEALLNETWFQEQEGSNAKPLNGKSVLITAGPTHERIDPVRYIANRSSGKQGFALAKAAHELGAAVTLIAGPCQLPTPKGVVRIDCETAEDMLAATTENLPQDVVICAAAVADWRVANTAREKLKKSTLKQANDGTPHLTFKENPDILQTIANAKNNRPELVIGFAAETKNVIEEAKAKRTRKNANWIIANDVSPKGNVFGNDQTTIHIIDETATITHANLPKQQAAMEVMRKVAKTLNKAKASAK